MSNEAKASVPRRPKIDDAMILQAATEIAGDRGWDIPTIVENYRVGMDGYELARELDWQAGWDLTMDDVEHLDGMSDVVWRLERQAEKKWFAENDIPPPLPIGTPIKEGLITGICEHSPAKYLVKTPECIAEGHRLLVNFEDAVAEQRETEAAEA